jgi:NADH dehydrogenase
LELEAFVILSNEVLQICQVLCVLLLAPLLQGFILKAEERVQRSRGPSVVQPYRDLWKLFHKQSVVPESASWVYFIAPILAFTAMLVVPLLIPVLADRPLPLSDMGDILGGGMILTLGSFAIILAGLDSGNVYGGIGSSRAAMLAILAEPTLILVLVGVSMLAKAMLPFVVNHLLLESASIWSGGRREDTRRIATTSLAFSNALRTFYGFIYGPTHNLEREYDHGPYFVKRLIFNQEVAPIFGPYLFAPLTRLVRSVAARVSALQSGYLNFYNALVGMLLVLILGLTLFYK